MTSQFVCTKCEYIGETVQTKKGNGWIELILYFFYIIPGIIYSIWRRSAPPVHCPLCNSLDVVPADSPVGRRILEEQRKAHKP